MNKLIGVLIFLLVLSVAAFAVSAEDPTAVEATIIFEGMTVKYVGKINDQNVERLLELASGKPVTELIISSGGGEINAGMQMGEWVYDSHIDVVVDGMCASSCANYVFTAGRQKTIKERSIVAWHGSILQETGLSDEDIRAATIEAYQQFPKSAQAQMDLQKLIDQSIKQMHEYQAASKAKQAEFFNKIGVDEYVCRVGNEEYGAKDFFLLSVEDMARFGIDNVTAPDNYEDIDLTAWQVDHSVEFVHLLP